MPIGVLLQALRRAGPYCLTYNARRYTVRDLAAFPGNRLEALAGDRRGQHSIRVNDHRICFVWRDGDADHVEIVDYH